MLGFGGFRGGVCRDAERAVLQRNAKDVSGVGTGWVVGLCALDVVCCAVWSGVQGVSVLDWHQMLRYECGTLGGRLVTLCYSRYSKACTCISAGTIIPDIDDG